MKILFVDDEPRILEGIERMLFHLADEWDLNFATNGYEALEILKEGDFDVIVTDIRMPGMDGSKVLAEVAKQYPNIVRIVLSGHAEQEAALRAVPVAHQYLNKPCKAHVLQDVVERACSLNSLLTDSKVREVVGKIDKLPSIPSLYSALTKALSNPKTTANQIADIIKQDPAMTSKILQLVNSAFFGRSKTVTNVNQAVVRLGFKMVKNLVLSVEIFETINLKEQIEGFSLEQLHQHSLRSASIAAKLFTDKTSADDAFMATMLHDIGKLLLVTEMPERVRRIVRETKRSRLSFYTAEKKLYQITHAEIGAYLLSLWGLPYSTIEAIANHHEPGRVTDEQKMDVLAAVYIADHLDNRADLDADYIATLNVGAKLEEWREMAATIDQNKSM